MSRKSESKERQIVGISKDILEVRQRIKSLGKKDTPVLILGPTGTGKELVANNIHYASKRKEKPFIPVNCAAIPDQLLESELFGFEKGAFTDAKKERKGKFELANGGTIFLDEIGDMSPNLQAKLLRILQDNEIWRIGGEKPIKVDTRIIASTNKKMEEGIKKGWFREDLYYRLSKEVLRLEPLADHPEDVIALTNYFIHEDKMGRKVDHRVKFLLYTYDWPGNVRELESMVQHIDDFHYVKRELEREWEFRTVDELEDDLKELKNLFGEEEEENQFTKTTKFLKKTDVDFKKYIEIYEIIMLNGYIKKDEIRKVLHLKRDKVFNFEKNFNFKLDLENDIYLVSYPLDVYPEPKTVRKTCPNLISPGR